MAMIKALFFGNLMFAALVWGWRFYVHFNLKLTIEGAIFAFLAFSCGAMMGFGMNGGKPKIQRPGFRPRVRDSALDQLGRD